MLLAFVFLLAQSWPSLAADAQTVQLRLSILTDADGRMDLAGAMAAAQTGRFTPLPPDSVPNLGFTDSAIWLKADIDGLQAEQAPWYLELLYPPLDDVRAHVLTDGSTRATHELGEHAAGRRPLTHRYPAFALPTDADSAVVYLRIRSEGGILLPLRVLPQAAFNATAADETAFYAGYFAALGAMLLYNAFLWLSVRHPSYVLYVAYLACFAGLQFQTNGFAAVLLPAEVSAFGNPVLLLLLAATEATGLQFVVNFLDSRTQLPHLHRLMMALTWFCVAAGVLALLLPYGPVLKLLLALAVAVLVLISITIARALYAGQRAARFLALAFAALAPGCAIFVLRTTGVLPSTFVTEHVIELSTALEMVLLSFALADRINVLQAEQRNAEQALQQSAREHAERLVRSLEDERRRVAGELHDSIGQNLLVIGNQISRVRSSPEAAALSDRLDETAELARQTVRDVRAIAQQLYPQQLERLGLRDALEARLTQAFAPSGMTLHLDLPAELPELPAEDSAHIFHIAQEAASNALRHSQARNCWIALSIDAGALSMTVADDGRGGVNGHAAHGGLGLNSQRERAKLLGAEIAVTERHGGGTQLELFLPLGEQP